MKNNLLNSILIGCFLIFASACGQDATKKADNKPTTTATETTTTKPNNPLPSIRVDMMKVLFETSTSLDVIFYNLSFSMSMDKPSSIHQILNYVSQTPPLSIDQCPADGRIFILKSGEHLIEADLHLSEGCFYFVFYENGKKKYANLITEQGVAYFKKLFTQIKTQAPKQ